jgi:predicted dehydrogenase
VIHSTRRAFLKRAATGVAGALAFPTIIPAHVLGADAPSKKIQMAQIGCGRMGHGDMSSLMNAPEVRYVAVCDVDHQHGETFCALVNKHYATQDCRIYNDYRELLARGDLDAVSIAVPDHWHALIAVAALRASCDVYGQKPLARSIREGQAICQAVRRYGRVWQTGSQQRSDERFWHGAELALNGRLGKISLVEVGLPSRKPEVKDVPPSPPPGGLDWNLWLGPAPARPFCKFGDRTPHWDWRWISDYSGGQITDWSGHHIDIGLWGLGLDHTGPVEVSGVGEYNNGGIWDTPNNYDLRLKFAPGVQFHVSSRLTMGTKWIGDKGSIWVTRGEHKCSNPTIWNEKIGLDEKQLYHSRNHYRDFVDCVLARRDPVAPVEAGHRAISCGLLGEIAMLTGRKLRWNPEQQDFIGDPAASTLLGRSYREPWKLEA